MITRKFKKCLYCDSQVYAKGLCKFHYYKRLNKQTKQKKHLKPKSQKYSSKSYQYKKARKAFFSREENHICQVGVTGICTVQATDLHHKAGRVGELLTNPAYFLAVCRSCHQYLHVHSKWAEDNNFIIHLN